MRCREAALHRRVMLAEIRTDLQWVRYGRAMLSVDKCLTKKIKIKKKSRKKSLKNENLGKNELAETARQRLSNANKKPSKNNKKTLRRPRKF